MTDIMNSAFSLQSLKVGDELPVLETGKISRHDIALYAAGSGDLNPIHVDSDFAQKKASLPDVIVHGMYSMGCLGRIVSGLGGPSAVKSIDARFESMLSVNESLICKGEVVKIDRLPDGVEVEVNLLAVKPDGVTVSSGSSVLFFKNQ